MIVYIQNKFSRTKIKENTLFTIEVKWQKLKKVQLVLIFLAL